MQAFNNSLELSCDVKYQKNIAAKMQTRHDLDCEFWFRKAKKRLTGFISACQGHWCDSWNIFFVSLDFFSRYLNILDSPLKSGKFHVIIYIKYNSTYFKAIFFFFLMLWLRTVDGASDCHWDFHITNNKETQQGLHHLMSFVFCFPDGHVLN